MTVSSDENKLNIPIICGPTASGKSAVAFKLAQTFPVEIVSADSRQIIKHLNIGTAKPTDEEKKQANFHLIDIIKPGERYTAFRFIDNANQAIEDILKRNKVPIVVGGTGLYLRALTEGVVEIEQEDYTIREKLENELEEKGSEILFERLKKIDPLEAAKIHPNNHVRLIRALEIYYLTGKSKSEITSSNSYMKSDYDFEYFCLLPNREELYHKINSRVEQMLECGLLTEIKQLFTDGYEEKLKKANVIGYNELIEHLNGNLSYDEAVNLIKQNTRRYAKRQYTWFRRQIDGTFYDNSDDLHQNLSKRFYEKT